jgi:nucleotide-binding universal stress UspA family protein
MNSVDPLGIILAAVFFVSVAGLMIWMFHVPPRSTMPVAKAFRSLSAVHKFLVPITDAFPSERAIGLGCRLGQGDAEMILLNVILVPFTMALDTPLPAEESRAERTLELGADIAKKYGYTVRKRIIRHRSIPEGILHIAEEEGVDAIVLGVGVKTRAAVPWGKTSLELMRRATCEVIVDKVPFEEEPIKQS